MMLATDREIVERVLEHIANDTTDVSAGGWREPVADYLSPTRLEAERDRVLRRHPVPLCPSAALPDPGSFLARDAASTPLVAVRGGDGRVRAFRNVCRHRGAAVVTGTGCQKALICPYHGWTYRLDGRLRHVPDRYGFPDLDTERHGLVPVVAEERHGLVFVTQDGSARIDQAIDALAGVITPEHRFLAASEREEPTNWKILAETFLEGYHLRSLHRDTFYPVQFDNLNVVEAFGPNSRVTFPYRNITKLATVPLAERLADGRLTYVYHLFPNVMVATFPDSFTLMIVLEPAVADRTTVVTYALSSQDRAARPRSDDEPDLLLQGAAEDFAIARSIQHGLASGANTHLEFGRFEGAIAHFHRTLDAALTPSCP
jgi:phenylpropionate dioxygenase-like ring-hydroxylating dioxygenase large terminal subunit